MKIGVLVKQVATQDSELNFNANETWIDESNIEFDVNEADQYALEAGLQLKEALGGEVIAVSLGPERVEDALETALAKGADSAVHIVTESEENTDPFQVAAAFALVAREEQLDLILSGIQSDDLGYGQTPIILAEQLGFHHATMVVGIESTGSILQVRRELEGGWFQDMELPLPAVLTIQSGINEPRYASMKSIMAARRKTTRSLSGSEAIPTDVTSGTKLKRVYALKQSRKAEMLPGSPAEQAAALIEKLTYSARVL